MSGDSDGGAGEETLPAQFEAVLDATDSVVWEADLDELSVDYVGPAERVIGLEPDTATSPIELNARMVHPEDQLAAARQFEQLLSGEAESVDIEFRTSPESGPVRWVRMQGSVDAWTGGEPASLAGLVTDITPLKQREARLEEFAGVVSHDLRNPLSVATARVELAQDGHDSEHLRHARDALDRMDVLIENLLSLARADETVGTLEPVALGSVVRGAWSTVDTGDATLAVDTDLTVRANRPRLQQLLENLVRNALEHGVPDEEGDGSLRVRVGALDGGFFVADNGTGMAADRRERLFDRGATGEHVGLGLRIVAEVVEAHGWTVQATESKTGGARFEIAGVEPV